MRTFLIVLLAGAAVAGSSLLTPDSVASSATAPAAVPAAPVPPPAAAERLVAHEWGTFTSFSGADGVPLTFTPNNEDLPNFVYFQGSPFTKSGRLSLGGLVSMETPVVYFYTDREQKVTVKVDFPKGWITEWYPFAQRAPAGIKGEGGQSITWNVRLAPGDTVRLPHERNTRANHYYHARETDAVSLQSEVVVPKPDDSPDDRGLRGGSVLQREKFLFYRGVGTFAPPVTVKALGGDRVSVVNKSGGKATGLVLVTVRDGKIGFRPVAEIESGATAEAQMPATDGSRTELGAYLVKELTAAGLYEKEARAMVKTWDSAWFGEEGTRLLYLVPRAKTDELLPFTMTPKPTELVRVLVGRHDFLTPEAEAIADRELRRLLAAQKEANAASEALQKLGRFSSEAQQQAAKRLGPQK